MKASTSASAGSSSRAAARALALALLLCCVAPAHADQVYRTPESFVAGAFGNHTPEVQTIRINGDLRQRAAAILSHEPPSRARYWREGARTAWVLEEIGKEWPITVGIVAEGDHLQSVEVLIYRESRGWEVRTPGFLRQFDGVTLSKDGELNRTIDGISGATLSVGALRRLAQLALLLHGQVLGSG